MNRILEWIDRHWTAAWLSFCMVVIVALAVLFHGNYNVHAAPVAKQQEAGCTQFTKAGMWDIYECVDSQGNHFEANSAGMLIAVGN